jgi:hypothetical protein
MIIDFDTWLNARTGGAFTLPEYLRDRWSRGPGGELPKRPADEQLEHRKAFIDEGRWLVSCACNSAAYVTPSAPYFICAVCGRRDWYLVYFPADKADIEAVLELRPERANQNWYPEGALAVHAGETLNDLIEENRAHGVDVPDHLEGRAVSNGD